MAVDVHDEHVQLGHIRMLSDEVVKLLDVAQFVFTLAGHTWSRRAPRDMAATKVGTRRATPPGKGVAGMLLHGAKSVRSPIMASASTRPMLGARTTPMPE